MNAITLPGNKRERERERERERWYAREEVSGLQPSFTFEVRILFDFHVNTLILYSVNTDPAIFQFIYSLNHIDCIQEIQNKQSI